MAQYYVTDPQGTQHIINGPDGATPDQVISQAQNLVPPSAAASPDVLGKIENAIDPSKVIPAAMGAITAPLGALAGKVYDADTGAFSAEFPKTSAVIKNDVDTVGKAADAVKSGASDIVNNNPALKSLASGPVIAALKDTANVLPAALPAEGALEGAADDAANIVRQPPTPKITQDQARTLAGTLYKKADDIGAVASPSFTDGKILSAINSQTPETEAGSIGRASEPFTNWALDANAKLSGKPQSLTALQELDGNLSDQIDKYTDKTTGLPTSEATPFINVRQQIRAATNPENLSDGDLQSGAPEALQAWKDGQAVWRQSYQAGDIERINNRAALMPNPSQAIQAGYRQLARSDAFKGYTPEQQALIKQAAKTGVAVRGLQFIGSGLTTIGAGLAGGPLAGVGGFVAGIPARAAAEALQARPAAALSKSLSEGILSKFPDYVAPVPDAPEPQKLLAGPQRPMVTDSSGVSRPMTDQEWQASQAGADRAKNIGLTTDVSANINRLNIRAKFGPAFDALDEDSKNKIAAQVDKMWQANPKASIPDLIGSAKQMSEMLAHEAGIKPPSGTMAAALAAAKRGR